jgi:hypothetical protein
MTRIIAIDWSGVKVGAARKIWIAEARDGDLVMLERGRDRDEVAAWLIAEAAKGDRLIVGMDFAFSFPAWFLDEYGCAEAADMWRIVAEKAEGWLAACDYPFWGRPGRRRLVEDPKRLRRTEGESSAKSVFQIGGAGAVGTGSLRGMPVLLSLLDSGFAIWPFTRTPPDVSIVVEIYPRVWSPRVKKSIRSAREDALALYSGLGSQIRALAAFSEDSFDAAISALAMDARRAELKHLPVITDPTLRREGIIWSLA